MTLKVLELFGGIGACTAAMKRLGIDFEVVDYVEIDKHAVASYNAINGTNFTPQDVTKWDKDIKVDFIMHGSPCQDFSLAGVQKGGDKGSGTRSSLMYETVRIVEKLRPKYVCWENVANLLSEKHFHNFANYINTLAELGYSSAYKVLNAKDYGIPQNRERVFTISVLGGASVDLFGHEIDFHWPQTFPLEKRLKDLLELEAPENNYISEAQYKTIFGKQRIEKKWVYVDPDVAGTLTARMFANWNGNYITNQLGKIRQLSPRECWRLMGRTDTDFEKAEKVCSNSQLYKQAGNSIVVDVLVYLFGELFRQYPTEDK